MPFWWQQLREEISPAQVIPDRDLRPRPHPTLNLASDAANQDTGQRMPKPMAPHKSMPNLWSMGTLEDGLFPGTPLHRWGGPHLPDLENGISTGMPWRPSGDPHFSPEPQPNPMRVVPMAEPRFQPPAHVPDMSSELRVDEVVARKKTSFIVDTGATFSLLTSYSGPTQNSELTIKGVSGVPLRPKISPPLLCQFGKSTLIHSFLIMPQCPVALLGRDLVSKLGVFITIPLLDTVSIFCMKITPGLSLSLNP